MNLNLRLNGARLPEEKVVKFLGIKFDEYCHFDHQIAHIKSVVMDRLNLLKVISHKSWQLSLINKRTIYLSLVRSTMEYSAFLLPILSKELIQTLKVIENTALRTILNITVMDGLSNEYIHEATNVECIKERLNKLKSEISKDANSKIEAINEEIKQIKL